MVGDVDVAQLADELAGVIFKCRGSEGFCSSAQPAQQVMTMFTGGAQSVEKLTIFGALRLGHRLIDESSQYAIHGGEPDLLRLLLAQLTVELLRAAKTLAAAKRIQHRVLSRRAPAPTRRSRFTRRSSDHVVRDPLLR